MKNLFPRFMPLLVTLCAALLFQCSSNLEPLVSTENYCVYHETKHCDKGNYIAACPDGGELKSTCPYDNINSPSDGSSSSSVPSEEYGNSSSGKSSSSSNRGSSSSSKVSSSSVRSSSSGTTTTPGTGGPVAYYGELKASGNKLVGSKTGSTAVQVRGVSLFWSNTGWGGDKFFTADAVNAMVDGWKAEVIRVPIGYSEDGGYKTDASNKTRVKVAIDAAIAKGVYVIIDWHSHNAHNELSAATSFFTEMAQTYGAKDNVIFEIYNEPLSIDWSTIKTYANSIISTIRQYSDNLILVGTPNWDQDVNVAANSQVSDTKNNIAYVFHFYAASHSLNTFGGNINAVLNAGYPVFVSEYGTVSADGNGSHNESASDAWMTFLNSRNISYCAWSVNNKNEAASSFKPTFTPSASAAWTSTSNMTTSGQYVYSKLVSWASSAPWRGASPPAGGGGEEEEYGESCGGYCLWNAGECSELRTDPEGRWGNGTTCTLQIGYCGSNRFKDVNCTIKY